MLGRLARPRADICLRCSFRLSQHELRLVSSYSAQDPSSNSQDATPAEPPADGETDTRAQSGAGHGHRSFTKTGQKRRRAGDRLLTVDSAALGTSMLGKPASAIVLRDTGVYKKKDRTEKYEPEPAQATVDLEAILEKQGLDPTAEDVIANIESLKPVDERQLSEREFRKLQDMLVTGFTAPQLQAYLQWHASKPLPKLSSERMASRLAWIKSMTPWTPLGAGSDSLPPEDAPLQGYMPATASPKERTAIRILHEVWGLAINELAMVLGEVRVKVRAAEFVLLQRRCRNPITRLPSQDSL